MERKSARRNKSPQKPESPLNAPQNFARDFLVQAQHSLVEHHLPRIIACLEKLSDEDVWWRPNAASNSAGNLALHLAGNVRQWIVSGLGGEPDIRNRDQEFQEQGPIPKRVLVALLQKTVKSACRTLGKLSSVDLRSDYTIQKFHVTGFEAVTHITEHFAYHTGQIIYVTKLRSGEDLNFTRLPGDIRRKPKRPRLSAV
ncbi:MAG TPA: DinB family protein [Terriglobia bacterium]|nr:DinB family protein [Terriglobia bacterium]